MLTFTSTLESDTINTVFVMGLSTTKAMTEVHTIDQRWPFKVYLPLVMRNQ